MLRLIKIILVLAIASGFAPKVSAFSLLGPFDAAYQTPALSYNPRNQDIGGPMNLGEEYRWNVPIITYAFDSTFLSYYGSNGVAAVDKAFDIINGVTTNINRFSSNLVEFPMTSQRINYQASALSILDLKSYTLAFMMEELGLASPSRYAWTLRAVTPITVGNVTYTNFAVIQRNFDPVTLQPSSYVNGFLYTYSIVHYIRPIDYHDAIETVVDPLAFANSAVADGIDNTEANSLSLQSGGYYAGLTRDDVGGLRYLLNPKNYNQESLPPNTEIAVTNTSAAQFITTTSLNDLIAVTENTTNNPAQLLTLYPNLELTSTNYVFTNLVTTNNFVYFTNQPWAPVGTPPILATNSTYTTNAAILYNYTYDNVKTNHVYPNGYVTLQTTTVAPAPWAPVGSLPVTTYLNQTSISNFVNGDVLIVPTTNYGYYFVYTNLPNLVSITNTISFAQTNQTSTNAAVTNYFAQQVDYITYYTNTTFIAYPIEWQSTGTNIASLRPGRGSLTFQKVGFDSVIGANFVTITNVTWDRYLTNSVTITNVMRRLITTPDILFVAQDLGLTVDGYPVQSRRTDTTGWQNNSVINGRGIAAGPGVILPPIQFSFSRLGDYILNETPSYLSERTGFKFYVMGSFDGTTNAPVLYPENGALTMEWLEQQILGH